jgi:RNA polymerase sigma-70 factor (ECF subfamily)
MKDSEIIELYWKRDETAINKSAKHYGAYCYSIAYNILRNKEDSDECVNDTWLKSWNAIPPQYPNKLSAFLGKITRNLSLDRWKAITAKKRGGNELTLIISELDDCFPAVNTVEQVIADAEFKKIINHFLHMLPERECNLFLSRYWYGNSLSKIAHMFSMKENSVKASLYRTRKRLKEYLNKEDILL